MVYVELSHNPFLRETLVRFNGREPRVNSTIERYLGEQLPEWVDAVPKMFFDEMNGYDFELVFSGTSSDFQALIRSFADAGVAEEDVFFVH